MLGVCLKPSEYQPGWDLVEIQFEKSVSYDPKWKYSGPRFAVHAPYYVTLTSPKQQKVDDAINRIIEAGKVAEKLNADIIITRAGFYSKRSREEVMSDLVKHCEKIKHSVNVPLGIETQGRATQFGSLDEVLELSEKTGVVPVINLPAIIERQGTINIKRVLDLVEKPYIHFNESIDLEELASALPQKYTLVAEDIESAEKMKTILNEKSVN